MKVFWIGTGVMGAPMAKHLAKAGYEVFAFNRTIEKAKALLPDIQVCQTIEEGVKKADVVFTIVGYPKDVDEVYQEIMKHAKPNTILIDMTTSSPILAKAINEKAQAKQLHFLDAPVTGGDIGAINGTLSIMVGGNEKIYEKVVPLLQCLGKTITYMGQAGSGMMAKLVNQVVIAGNILGIAEGLTLAQNKGLDLKQMLTVITGGSANSWQAQNNGPKMIQQDFQPGFFNKHFLKDLKLAKEAGLGLGLHVLEQAESIYQKLIDEEKGDEGTQSVIQHYQEN